MRTAISPARPVARASWRLATLEHAISSTNATTQMRIEMDSRGPALSLSRRSRTMTRSVAFEAGYCAASRLTMVLISCCAAGHVTPGLRRP